MVAVGAEDKELLQNVNQRYLYERTNHCDDETVAPDSLYYGDFDETDTKTT